MRFFVVISALLSLTTNALDPAVTCPLSAAGTNVHVSAAGAIQSIAASPYLPGVPYDTISSNYGPASLCGFAGTIVVGGPLSLTQGDSWYGYSIMIKQSIQIFLDWLNGERGGLLVGGQRYAMRFVWVDDRSKKDHVANATAVATRGVGADFAFGGYSSGLTTFSALQAALEDRVMIAAGAAATSVFTQTLPNGEGMNSTFGFFPPAGSYHDNSLGAAAAAAQAIDAGTVSAADRVDGTGPCFNPGQGGCYASLRVGFIQSAASFTRAQCSAGAVISAKHGLTAVTDPDTGSFLRLEVPRNPSALDQITTALTKMQSLGVNVIVGCTYINEAFAITAALEKLDYAPFMLSVSASLGTSRYTAAIGDGWWQGAYNVGPSPWHISVPIRGAFSGMTSTEFATAYAVRYGGQAVSYHGAAPFGGCVALAAAIEAAQSFDTQAVAHALKNLDVLDFYGRLSFDSNRQIGSGMLVLQYAPAAATEEVTYPAASVSTGKLHFPWPSWGQRRCRAISPGLAASSSLGTGTPPSQTTLAAECSGHGTCDVIGNCQCEPGWSGADCGFEERSCSPGYIVVFRATGLECRPCEPGTYEYANALCEESDSRHYVPTPAATVTDKVACPAGTAVHTIFEETDTDGTIIVAVQRRTGAANVSECTCIPGYYEEPADQTGSDSASVCTLCPVGARCIGASFPPVALAGYGQLVDGGGFFPCPGQGRCPGPTCDCLGGSILSSNETIVSSCGLGYVEGSPLCSMCDSAQNYATRLSVCEECSMPGTASLFLSIIVIIVWFPLIGKLTERMESLEITFAFIQFLGLYGSYSAPWRSPLGDLLGYASLFNLDVNMMHLACFPGFSSWETMWLAQVMLPVLYVPLSLVHIVIAWTMMKMCEYGLPPTKALLKLGWRPRLDYSLSSLRDTYLPNAALYMHIYYITGIYKANEVLICNEGDDGKFYLAADPSLVCYEEKHLILIGFDVVAIAIYYIGVPLFYFYLLFVLVRRAPMGVHDAKLNYNFGFVWGRFEEDVYWWELVDIIRKLGLVLVGQLVRTPMVQTIVGAILIGIVLAANFYFRPYKQEVYDFFDMFVSSIEMIIFMLGTLVITRPHVDENGQFGTFADGRAMFDDASVLEGTVLTLIPIVLISGLFAIVFDCKMIAHNRRANRVRDTKGVSLNETCFHIKHYDPALVYWAEEASEKQLALFRKVEKMLTNVSRDLALKSTESRRTTYGEQLTVHERVLNWLAERPAVGNTLKKYVSEMALAAVHDMKAAKKHDGIQLGYRADKVIGEVIRPATALWLAEMATQEEKEAVAALLSELGAYHEAKEKEKEAKERVPTLKRIPTSMQLVVPKTKGKNVWERAQKATLKKEKNDMHETLRLAELTEILDELCVSVNCEHIVLVPVTAAHKYVPLPRLIIESYEYNGGDQEKEKAAISARTDWKPEDQTVITPAGMCLEEGKAVLVDCFPLDTKRFPDASKKAGLLAISQLCVPVVAGKTNDAMDAFLATAEVSGTKAAAESGGATIIGILKCINKVAFSGTAAGVPFDPRIDVDLALSAARKLVDRSQSYGARRKAAVIMSRFGKGKADAAKPSRLADAITAIPAPSCSAVPPATMMVEDADEDLELGDDVSKGAVATRFASAAQVLPPKPSKEP